ncbi:MAG: hypothetical protein JXA44_12595 [Methanospirillaceae archaeon]|nr:hypothetical protein [Methanospirillaceae archaeon]
MHFFWVILGVVTLTAVSPISVTASSFSSYSYIDTIGPVIEETNLVGMYQSFGPSPGSGSYQESTKTNNGHLVETKTLAYQSGMVPLTTDNIISNKILTFESNGTGGTLMASEGISLSHAVNQSDETGVSCILGADESITDTRDETIHAGSALMGVTSISYSSHGAVRFEGTGDPALEYSVHVEPDTASGKEFAEGTVTTGYTYQTYDGVTRTRGSGYTLTSGLISFVDQILTGGGGQIQITDQSSAIGTTITDTSHRQESYREETVGHAEQQGWKVYEGELRATGGELNQTRDLRFDGGIETDWIFSFASNESQSGTITAKEVVVAGGTANSEEAGSGSCIFADPTAEGDLRGYEEAIGSMDMIGVSRISAQTSSYVPCETRSAELSYTSSFVYPEHFESALNRTVGDINADGIYEDLNNNKRLDLHDIVLLFTGYEAFRSSANSTLYDYNRNNRFDLADLVELFESL